MLNETLNKVTRLMYILNELDNGEIFVTSIAKDLDVTIRTVQRDLRILEDAGFPFANTKKGAYCFIEGFSLQRMRLNAKEAAMLALIGDIAHNLGGGFADTYKELRNKIVENRRNPFFIKIIFSSFYCLPTNSFVFLSIIIICVSIFNFPSWVWFSFNSYSTCICLVICKRIN